MLGFDGRNNVGAGGARHALTEHAERRGLIAPTATAAGLLLITRRR
jgi:hypothetical protein